MLRPNSTRVKFYPKTFPSGITTGCNKKVNGIFKDEVGGQQILEFIGLKAKFNYFRMKEKAEKKCKGIRKFVIKKKISFQDYKDCLFSQEKQMRRMNVIRSHRHDVYREEGNKIALSATTTRK